MSKKPDLTPAISAAHQQASEKAALIESVQIQQRKSNPTGPLTVVSGDDRSPQPRHNPATFGTSERVMVSFGTKLPHALREQINRIHLERQLDKSAPWQIQEIVEEALGLWLEKYGYRDQPT